MDPLGKSIPIVSTLLHHYISQLQLELSNKIAMESSGFGCFIKIHKKKIIQIRIQQPQIILVE